MAPFPNSPFPKLNPTEASTPCRRSPVRENIERGLPTNFTPAFSIGSSTRDRTRERINFQSSPIRNRQLGTPSAKSTTRSYLFSGTSESIANGTPNTKRRQPISESVSSRNITNNPVSSGTPAVTRNKDISESNSRINLLSSISRRRIPLPNPISPPSTKRILTERSPTRSNVVTKKRKAVSFADIKPIPSSTSPNDITESNEIEQLTQVVSDLQQLVKNMQSEHNLQISQLQTRIEKLESTLRRSR